MLDAVGRKKRRVPRGVRRRTPAYIREPRSISLGWPVSDWSVTGQSGASLLALARRADDGGKLTLSEKDRSTIERREMNNDNGHRAAAAAASVAASAASATAAAAIWVA